jgi:hypothetical protein
MSCAFAQQAQCIPASSRSSRSCVNPGALSAKIILAAVTRGKRWSTKEQTRHADPSHNACFYTVANRPWNLEVLRLILIQACLCYLVVIGNSVLAVCGTWSSWVPPRWCRITYLLHIWYMQIRMNIEIWSYWLIWNICRDARAFFQVLQLICRLNQPCAWIQQLIWKDERRSILHGIIVLLESTVKQPEISLKSTNPAWLLVESTCGWIKQISI